MSTSSEIVNSGRFSGQNMQRAPEKSNFSQTCQLLGQYLKEKGTLGDLTLGMGTSSALTMNLFPGAEKPGSTRPASFPQQTAAFAASPVSNQEAQKKQPESAQMTIFYGGQVVVFDDLPADKASEIMSLAGKVTAPKPKAEQPPPAAIRKPVVFDLPIKRTASLTRFLEKRKDRIMARAPYQQGNNGSSASSSKADDSKVWLGLGAQSAVQFQPQT